MLLKNAQLNSLARGINALEVQEGEVVMVLMAEKNAEDINTVIEFLNKRNIVFFGGLFPGPFFGNDKLSEGCILNKFKAAAPPFLIKGISSGRLDGMEPIQVLQPTRRFAAITLTDGQSSQVNHFLKVLNSRLGSFVNFLGGETTSNTFGPQPRLFTNQGAIRDAAICCIVEKKVNLMAKHGWQKLAGPVVKADEDNTTELLHWQEAFRNYTIGAEQVPATPTNVGEALKLLKKGIYDNTTGDAEAKGRVLDCLAQIKHFFFPDQKRIKQKTGRQAIHLFEDTIIGNSKPMQQIFRLMEKAIRTDITVSITGETGTGKEVVAKSIHQHSARRKGPFVAVNMSAIPRELVESELFGYEKGAFTGAAAGKKGQFELADGGTLFLDEIAEMGMDIQAKLLRALQEREFVRVGGEQPVPYNARIIIATHKDLAQEVQKGHFREDLYYRLLGLNLNLPPLRQRGNDIILLAQLFLQGFAQNNALGHIEISKEAKTKLLQYNYPGNVRELKAIIELAAVMATDGIVEAADIQFNSVRRESTFLTDELTLEQYKNRIIKHFLKKYDNDVLLVAQKLNVGKSTIYRMLKNQNTGGG